MSNFIGMPNCDATETWNYISRAAADFLLDRLESGGIVASDEFVDEQAKAMIKGVVNSLANEHYAEDKAFVIPAYQLSPGGRRRLAAFLTRYNLVFTSLDMNTVHEALHRE